MSGSISVAMLQRGSVATVATPDDVLPVSTLALGAYSVNHFTGFTSPATTVYSNTRNLIHPTLNDGESFISTTNSHLDSEVHTWTGYGYVFLRVSGSPGSQTGIYFRIGPNDIRVGMFTGFDTTVGGWDMQGAGFHYYPFYVNTNVSGSAEGIAAGYGAPQPTDSYTFGYVGFQVYLQFNGTDLIRYTEWRVGNAGQVFLGPVSGFGFSDVTVHYPLSGTRYSNPATNTYDTRDFGMRAVAAVTGSMSASSNQLVLASNVGFRVGDQIIVEIGGEASGSLTALASNLGGGLRNSVGVGGYWPTLSYANTTAMNADTSKPNSTWAYLPSNGFVYAWDGVSWSHRNDGAGAFNQSYYSEFVLPLPLVAKITAINGAGTTLTLDKTATAATTNANVWLDSLPSFAVLNSPSRLESSYPATPTNLTLSIPAGTWPLSGPVVNNSNIPITNGFTVSGAGRTQTTLFSPKGSTCGAINLLSITANNVTIKDFKYIGNHGDNGFGPSIVYLQGSSVAQTFSSPPGVLIFPLSGSGNTVQNIDGVNTYTQAAAVSGGTNPQVLNCTVNIQTTQHSYIGWQIQILNSSGGQISGCTATSPYLLKSFELFACNGTSIVGCAGQNATYSTNSSTSWTIDMSGVSDIITTNSYSISGPHWIDEPVITVSSHAYQTGGSGTIINPNITQQGYINTASFVYPPVGRTDYNGTTYGANNSLRAIDVEVDQPHTTITGGYPLGGGGNGSGFLGLIIAPDYDSGSTEYGSMGIMSQAAFTSVTGIRVKGTAIGSPGHSTEWGNISISGANGTVTNCVADVIRTGPTLSGNQTNATYGP